MLRCPQEQDLIHLATQVATVGPGAAPALLTRDPGLLLQHRAFSLHSNAQNSQNTSYQLCIFIRTLKREKASYLTCLLALLPEILSSVSDME